MGFAELAVGDTVELKGSLGCFVWEGNGVVKWKGVEKSVRTLAMVCGGSGEFLLSIPSRRSRH
jgi:nitrate reductase (NAD(P)H)